MPGIHSHESSLDSQLRDFKNKINDVNSHRSASLHSERPHSLDIPFDDLEAGHETGGLPLRATSVNSGQRKTFDLMAPPPGKRRSHKSTMNVEPVDSVDANPSETLTKQIASSVLQERYGPRNPNAAPPKVQESVRRCLPDVSETNQSEEPRGDLPKYHSSNVRSALPGSRSSSRDSGYRQKRFGVLTGEDDSFLYERHANGRVPSMQVKRHDEPSSAIVGTSDNGAQGYPCPFRRRDPISFNVRDYESCGTRPFADMFELKRHIRTQHRTIRQPYHCPRCKKGLGGESELSEHLTVSLEEMCEPRAAASVSSVADGITEEMDWALANSSSARTWENIWRLLFPHDASVLDPEFMPIVEAFEVEQEFDHSTAELKADLCESLEKLLPDQAGDTMMFQVLAGQLSLVFEQHRAKVNRRCRGNAYSIGGEQKPQADRTRPKASRFSVAIYGAGVRSSLSYPDQSRRSRTQSIMPRTTNISPASSVYSQRSSSQYSASNSSRPPTRSSSLSTTGGMQVESPRLPFRDWVHSVKFNNELVSPAGQRDSGLAMQCEECSTEPCSCVHYADQLSAFMTPATGNAQTSLTPYGMRSTRGSDGGEIDWAAHYGEHLLPSGGLPTGSSLGRKVKLGHDNGHRVAVEV